jgi:hypothetical protein
MSEYGLLLEQEDQNQEQILLSAEITQIVLRYATTRMMAT